MLRLHRTYCEVVTPPFVSQNERFCTLWDVCDSAKTPLLSDPLARTISSIFQLYHIPRRRLRAWRWPDHVQVLEWRAKAFGLVSYWLEPEETLRLLPRVPRPDSLCVLFVQKLPQTSLVRCYIKDLPVEAPNGIHFWGQIDLALLKPMKMQYFHWCF